jgi:adenylyltransferase/sulfurtransferase
MNTSTRYSRQIRLAEVGDHGQGAIKNAKVLIVGMGGLGHPVAQYLAAAGVGCMGIMDGDVVEESNLHRQILFTQQDIGRSKVEASANWLRRLNSECQVIEHNEYLEFQNASEIISNYDIIVDCTDNFESKYLLNDTILQLQKILVSASITAFEGTLTVVKNSGPCLRCLYPQQTHTSSRDLNCNLTGVLGAFVGIVGSWQAAEVLKIILSQTSILRDLSGRVLFFDFYTSCTRTVSFQQNPDCLCVQRNFNHSGSVYLSHQQATDLDNVIFVDVAGPASDKKEGQVSVPYHQIILGEIKKEFWNADKNYVLCCPAGLKSYAAARRLREEGHLNIFSLRNP